MANKGNKNLPHGYLPSFLCCQGTGRHKTIQTRDTRPLFQTSKQMKKKRSLLETTVEALCDINVAAQRCPELINAPLLHLELSLHQQHLAQQPQHHTFTLPECSTIQCPALTHSTHLHPTAAPVSCLVTFWTHTATPVSCLITFWTHTEWTVRPVSCLITFWSQTEWTDTPVSCLITFWTHTEWIDTPVSCLITFWTHTEWTARLVSGFDTFWTHTTH